MLQTCQHCDYESPASARFCRQCGAPLVAETEFSAASTRNYGRQEGAPSVANAASGQLPPSVADSIVGETERYYKAPLAPPPPVPTTAPIKAKIASLRPIFLLLALFICILTTALVTAALVRRPARPMSPMERARIQAEEDARQRQLEERRRQEDERRQIQDRLRETQDRARQARDRQLEAIRQAREAAERASEAGNALPPANEKPLDLSQYEYPGAPVANSIRIPGYEMLTMRTPNDFDTVSQFYQRKIGEPVIRIDEPWEKTLVFQSSTAPLVSISVETDPEHSGQLKITVLRSPRRLIKPEDIQRPR